jgi:hypothetical protein
LCALSSVERGRHGSSLRASDEKDVRRGEVAANPRLGQHIVAAAALGQRIEIDMAGRVARKRQRSAFVEQRREPDLPMSRETSVTGMAPI